MSKKILVVDDEPELCMITAQLLARRGFEVLTAHCGEKAWEILSDQDAGVDLVLSDVRMPGVDGIELLKRIKDYNAEVPPVLFMSGFTDIQAEEAYDLGASGFFSKPFDRKELISAVGLWVEEKEARWKIQPEDFDQLPLMEETISKPIVFGKEGFVLSSKNKISADRIRFKVTDPHSEFEGAGLVRWIRTQGAEHFYGVQILFLNEDCLATLLSRVQSSKLKATIPGALS